MFGAATTYSVGASPESVAVGDLNGDGIADIAVGTYYGVSVLLGKGDGTFMAAVNYTVGSYGGGVAVSDVNGDGKADIVLADSSGASVLLGNGDGTFGAAASYSAGSNPYATAVAVEDFNGDGKPDLALASINYRSEEHTSELQSLRHLVCRLLLEKKINCMILQRFAGVITIFYESPTDGTYF